MSTQSRLKRVRQRFWYARSVGKLPSAVVCFDKDGNIVMGTHKTQVCLDRRTARLVARRINQALDAWAE